jgi:hypothetical protein
VPAVVSLNPRSGSGFTATFAATFSQSSNNHYLGYLLILPTPNVVNYTATGSCLIEYNKYSNGVRLIDDAGTDWLGPVSGEPIKPAAATLTNSRCSVNVANVIANISGSTMSVTAPVTFFQPLGPVLGTFLQAQDDKGVWTGMTQFGNWVLPGAPQNRPRSNGRGTERNRDDGKAGHVFRHCFPYFWSERARDDSPSCERFHRRFAACKLFISPRPTH